MIRKRPLAAGFLSLFLVSPVLAGAIVPAQAQSRYSDWHEIAVDEELGDELPAEQSLYEESVGESAEDADVDGEPAAGERPDPPVDDAGDAPDGGVGVDPVLEGSPGSSEDADGAKP